MKLKPNSLIVDPFMGSGAFGIAAIRQVIDSSDAKWTRNALRLRKPEQRRFRSTFRHPWKTKGVYSSIMTGHRRPAKGV
jgi:hypothetical protein